MGWSSDVLITDGYLQGKYLNKSKGQMILTTWTIPPDEEATNLKLVQGTDGEFTDVDILSKLQDMDVGDTLFLAGIEITPETGATFDRGEIRVSVYRLSSQSFSWSCIYRKYTGSSYVDVSITTPATADLTIYTLTTQVYFFLEFSRWHPIGTTQFTDYIIIGMCDLYSGVQYRINGFACPLDAFITLIGGTIPVEKDSPEFGKAGKKKGGYNWRKTGKKPTFDDHSDLIAPTAVPTEGVSQCGLVNVYQVNRIALDQLGSALFPQPTDIYQSLSNRYLMDYVVGCKLIPCRPSGSGGGNIIKVGYKTIQISSPGDVRQINSDYVEVDLGYKGLAEYWANFLDYSGTRAKLFLPFYGFVDIEPEFWNGGGQLHIVYRINIIDGSFIVMIRSKSGMSELNDSLIAQYSGSCGVDIPITGVQYGNMLARLGQNVARIGLSAVSGNMNGALSAIGNISSLKPDVPKSNGYNGNSGFMGHRRPFLLIERQVSQFSEKYPSEVGLPYYAMETIGNCHGLVVSSNAHLDGVSATLEEKELISQYLADGIIVDG